MRIFGAILSLILFAAGWNICGQAPSPSPAPSDFDAEKAVDDVKQPAAPASAAPDDLWHRDELTGDWGGVRARWKEHGLDMSFSLSGFVQGTASGGLRRDTEWNGKLESRFDLDFEKLWGWKNWSAQTKIEYRFGGPVLSAIGAINTVNTDASVPASQGSVAAITALNFTRSFPIDAKKGEMVAVSFGRFNTLDIQEKFFGGAGLQKFFNAAHIGPMTGLRQVPNVTNGVGVDYIRNGESFISFGLLDPNDHSTNTGLDHPFGDGVTLAPVINLPTKWFGRSGKHTFSYTVTTKDYTPFDAIKQIALPGPPANPLQPKGGSWSIAYVGRQYIVEHGPDDGWGVFTQVSFADKATSPVTKFFDLGIGGNGIFEGRRRDDFGIAYALTGLSSVLKENLDLASTGNVRPHAEHQFEGFYSLHITPWLRLTGDLQIIRPIVRRANTAVVPGARLEVLF